ncbi:hypothetical protein AAF712_011893 [Marasmius tenuissimus]|uniref:Uncharacterized protein n=1 Tax=Marasmius tenuissimus TaxID=585030 RepID=A0ABR2ZI00_9AGAR
MPAPLQASYPPSAGPTSAVQLLHHSPPQPRHQQHPTSHTRHHSQHSQQPPSTPIHQHHPYPPSSHPRHPDDDVVLVSPISPGGGNTSPVVASRHHHQPPFVQPQPPLMRRPSGNTSGSMSSTATLQGPFGGSGSGSGSTPRSPIVVSPVDPGEGSSTVGKRERDGRDLGRDDRRGSYPNGTGGEPRSRSGSGTGSRPSSVTLAPHLVRDSHQGLKSQHPSPDVRLAQSQAPRIPSPRSQAHVHGSPQSYVQTRPSSSSSHHAHSSPLARHATTPQHHSSHSHQLSSSSTIPPPLGAAQIPPTPASLPPAPHGSSLPSPHPHSHSHHHPPPPQMQSLPPPPQPTQLSQAPGGIVPQPGTVVYVVQGYPPGTSPNQMVQMAPSSSSTNSGNHHPPPPTSHSQPNPMATGSGGHPSNPMPRRASGALPPPQGQSQSQQAQGQPVQRRQTFPQQAQGGGAGGTSQIHTQPHHHHQQPHHSNSLPVATSTSSHPLPLPAPERKYSQPPSQSQRQDHHVHFEGFQQVHYPSGKPISPNPKPSVVTNTHATSSSTHHGPPSAHPNPPNSAHPSSSSASSHPPPGSLMHHFQRILNTAYLDLVTIVESKDKDRMERHDRAEREREQHRLEKERERIDRLEKVLEDKDRLLLGKDEEIRELKTVPGSEKEVLRLQSENTHLKGELMGLKSDKEDMLEEIDELEMKVREAAGSGGGGGNEDELVRLRRDVERLREEAEFMREERNRLLSMLEEREREKEEMIREHQQQLQQREANGISSNEEIHMITTSPTDAITASPLPFATESLPSTSPRPPSRQVETHPHDRQHLHSLPVPPAMGGSPTEVHYPSSRSGRPSARDFSGSRVDERNGERMNRQERPHLSLPVPVPSSRPSSAISPHPHSALPNHVQHHDRPPSRPSSRPSTSSASGVSPHDVVLPIPVPFGPAHPPPSSNPRPSSRTSLNTSTNGRKRHRSDADDEDGEISPRDQTSKSSAALPPRLTKQLSGREDGEILEGNENPKPSKVPKRSSGDDAASSSSSKGTASAPNSHPRSSTSNGFGTKNSHATPYYDGSGPPSRMRPVASAPVEDGVFRHVHQHTSQAQVSPPAPFWKGGSSSSGGEAKISKEKEVEEPKLGLKHFQLLYDDTGKEYVCRECKASSPPKRKIFPMNTAMPEMTDHLWKEHAEKCREVLKYSGSKLAEKQLLIKGGGGSTLGNSTGVGGRGGPSARKEKNHSK